MKKNKYTSMEHRNFKIPENRMEALRYLHISPTQISGADESPIFQLYLNYAVNNICEITGISKDVTSDGIERILRDQKDSIIRKLANFLWLFQADEPIKNYPQYIQYTIAVTTKIFELREFFVHLNQNDISQLTVDREFYCFVAGNLASQAISAAVMPGVRSAKVFKMKLFAFHDKKNGICKFTRRGLIFLICLALYKDEAREFTQCFEDMKFFCRNGKANTAKKLGENDEIIATRQAAVAKSFVAMFTYFSVRRGRSIILLEDDFYYMSFAAIADYLNRVPQASADYLALTEEKNMLRELYEKSTQTEENKKFKYSLHRRGQNRFLTFGATYIEDFHRLPSVKFKRLDIDISSDRKRYCFGPPDEERNCAYHIKDNAIRFEWLPVKHYGPIHIDSLRSSMSADSMKELLFAGFNGQPVNYCVNEYFSAYHRILETVINTLDTDDLYLEEKNLLEDFVTVSNVKAEDIQNDLTFLSSYFPENFIRFFCADDFEIDDQELHHRLVHKLKTEITHAQDFLMRLEKFNDWKKYLAIEQKHDPDFRIPVTECSSAEVMYPPRNCNFSDAALIAQVFKYFNLHLDNDQKFRQLPLGQQHRGERDYEYQFVRNLIGKFALDSNNLKYYIENRKTELLPAWDALCSEFKKIRKKNNGAKKLIPLSLTILAEAAVKCTIRYLNKKLEYWECEIPQDSQLLKKTCRKFGIRIGMPLDRTSLIKTILRIDLGTWMHAYDPETKKNHTNRTLDQEGHIVTQIPFPANFAQRIMQNIRKPELRKFLQSATDGKTYFNFSAAIREMDTKIKLRKFYDTSPLVEANIALKNGMNIKEISGLNNLSESQSLSVDISRNAIKKAITGIKEALHQDKILIKIAFEYWDAFQSKGSFVCQKKRTRIEPEKELSIYDFFDASVQLNFRDSEDERQIIIMPNDVNLPILSQIRKYAPIIASYMDPTGKMQKFYFYEMQKIYHELQAQDRRTRLRIIPLLNRFDYAGNIPSQAYIKGGNNREMEYKYFVKAFPALTWTKYCEIADCRNRIFHDDLNIELGDLEISLKELLSLKKKGYHQKNNKRK